MPSVEHTTQLLVGVRSGDTDAQRRLFEVVYGELRALAGSMFRGQGSEHTLQPTALVHEVWMKLVDRTTLQVRDRAHFMAIAATAMRQILIDHARAKRAEKRGGGFGRVTIDEVSEPAATGDGACRPLDVLALDEALTRLAALDQRQARIVELRMFGGLSVEETAEALSVSTRTIELDWRMARAWLSRVLSADA